MGFNSGFKGLKLKIDKFPPSVFMCFVFISEQTATSFLYNTNLLVFITEIKSVYCAV